MLVFMHTRLTYFAEPMLGRLLLAGEGTGGGENFGGAGRLRPWILIVSSPWRRSPEVVDE